MIKMFNSVCSSVLEAMDNALPVLMILVFYQMTILEIPVQEIMGMFGWVLFVGVGITLSL